MSEFPSPEHLQLAITNLTLKLGRLATLYAQETGRKLEFITKQEDEDGAAVTCIEVTIH